MKYRERLSREISDIDRDLRGTPLPVLFVIACLALVFAATIVFGGLHI